MAKRQNSPKSIVLQCDASNISTLETLQKIGIVHPKETCTKATSFGWLKTMTNEGITNFVVLQQTENIEGSDGSNDLATFPSKDKVYRRPVKKLASVLPIGEIVFFLKHRTGDVGAELENHA